MKHRLIVLLFLNPLILFAMVLSACAANVPDIQDSLQNRLRNTTGLEYIRALNARSQQLRIDSPEVAFQHALRAVVLSRKGKFPVEEAMAWRNLAMVSMMKGRFTQAEDYLTVAMRIATHAGEPSAVVTVYKSQGNLRMDQKRFREALENFLMAEKVRINAGLKPKADLYETLGDCYKSLNDNTRAVSYFRLAADFYSREDPGERLPFVLGYLAILYNEWGWNEQALDCFSKSLRLLLKSGDSIGAAYTYCNMADVYSHTVGQRKAADYTSKALEIFRRKQDHGGMGYALNCLGASFYSLGEKETALDYYRKSVAEHEKAGALEQLSFTLANIGEILMNEGNYAESFPYLQRAARYADSAKSDLAGSASLTSLGKYYQLTGNYPKSVSCILESQQIASQRGFKQLMSENYQALAGSSEKMGRFSQAYRYLKEHVALHDSLVSEKSRKAVAEMEARFALESKERLIERLTRENELKRETILSKNRFTVLILLSSLIVLILLSLLTRFYYLKVKAYKQTVKLTVEQMKIQNPAIAMGKRNGQNSDFESGKKSEEPDEDNLESSRVLTNRLKTLVEEEKMYLNPELSMSEIAERLRTNTTYLSRAVNEILKKNFPAYINELRIHEARRMLADPAFANRSIEGIALMAGFKSKSAFNDAFKRITGVTPSFFQRSALRLERPS